MKFCGKHFACHFARKRMTQVHHMISSLPNVLLLVSCQALTNPNYTYANPQTQPENPTTSHRSPPSPIFGNPNGQHWRSSLTAPFWCFDSLPQKWAPMKNDMCVSMCVWTHSSYGGGRTDVCLCGMSYIFRSFVNWKMLATWGANAAVVRRCTVEPQLE